MFASSSAVIRSRECDGREPPLEACWLAPDEPADDDAQPGTAPMTSAASKQNGRVFMATSGLQEKV